MRNALFKVIFWLNQSDRKFTLALSVLLSIVFVANAVQYERERTPAPVIEPVIVDEQVKVDYLQEEIRLLELSLQSAVHRADVMLAAMEDMDTDLSELHVKNDSLVLTTESCLLELKEVKDVF